MKSYARDEYLDEYEDWDEYEDEGASGEEYEQEEEGHQPTQEELSYLQLRERLKERMRKESGTNLKSSNKQSISTKNNFGSFFGPSQPVIAQRVIQESKSMLENPDLAAKVFKSSSASQRNKSSSSSAAAGSRPRVNSSASKATAGIQRKVEILKNTRDYSFLLSDDADVPAPKEDRTVQNRRPLKSDAQYMPQKIRELQSNRGKQVSDVREERRFSDVREERKQKPSGSLGQGRVHTGQARIQTQKLAPVGRPNQTSTSMKKPLYKSSGPGQPSTEKAMPLKSPSGATAGKHAVPHIRKPTMAQAQPSFSKRPVVQKTKYEELSKANIVKKQPVSSSRSQQMRPPQRTSSSDIAYMKKKPRRDEPRRHLDDEDDCDPQRISDMIRGIMGYNPNSRKFKERDEFDDSQMEVGFDDVMREEKRSARVAREEDEEEWRKIQEEEERERQRRKAKKRKLSQH